MDFIQAAELKHFILKNFSVALHIHDTCGGLYLTIDEPNEIVKEFIIVYCKRLSIPLAVSADGTSFYPVEENKGTGYGSGPGIVTMFEEDKNRTVAYEDDKLIGMCTFTESEDRWTIDHTWVDPSYRNQGIADMLVEQIAVEAKKRDKGVIPICSYAVKWFDEHI